MGAAGTDSFAVHITRPSLERLSMAEMDDVLRGVVFVPAAKPPRVGVRVTIDVTVADGRNLRHQGLVVWSRPARPGLSAGFRAQIENAHPRLLKGLHEVIDPIRAELAARTAAPSPATALDAPIRERVSETLPRLSARAPAGLEVHVDFGDDLTAAPSKTPPSDLRVRHLFRTPKLLALPPPLLALPGPPIGEQTLRTRRTAAGNPTS